MSPHEWPCGVVQWFTTEVQEDQKGVGEWSPIMKGSKRDKDRMARDVEIAMSSDLSDAAKYIVAKNVIWDWTLDGLTYKRNCRLVSQGVFELTQTYDLADKAVRKEWIFEHVVPVNVLVNLLGKAAGASDQRDLLDRYAIGCLVTKNEDQRFRQERVWKSMPKGWENGDDAFARYKQAGIKVIERE